MAESKKVTPKKGMKVQKSAAAVSSTKKTVAKKPKQTLKNTSVKSKPSTKKVATKKKTTIKSTAVKRKPTNSVAATADETENNISDGANNNSIPSPFYRRFKSKTPQSKKLNVISRYLMTPKSLITLVQFDSDEVAIQVARYGGVFSIIIGALFTVYFTTGLSDVHLLQQVATLSESSSYSYSSSSGSSSYSESSVTESSSDVTEPLLTKEMVSFDVAAASPLREKVPLIIQIPSGFIVNSVAVNAQNAETKQTHNIGFAQKKTETTYEIIFNTINVPNGKYRFVAAIRTPQNDVIVSSGDPYELFNYSLSAFEDSPIVQTQNSDSSESDLDDDSSLDNDTDSETDLASTTLVELDRESEEQPQVIEGDFSIENEPTNKALKLITYNGEAQLVEIFAKREGHTTSMFVGRAYSLEIDKWHFSWSTKNIPAGKYYLYAKVRASTGPLVTRVLQVIVEAPVFVTEAPVALPVTSLPKPDLNVRLALDPVATPEKKVFEKPSMEELSRVEFENSRLAKKLILPDLPDVLRKEIKIDDLSYDQLLQPELERLAVAVRSGDKEAESRIMERIMELEKSAIADKVRESGIAEEDAVSLFKRHTALRVVQTEKSERVISERLGEAASRDSDGDGVTDYDEVELFGTDPKNPDSDSDGFTDGAEILAGYNPLDSTLEAVVALESPKSSGLVRSDILKIESLSAVPAELAISSSPAAMITGKALPNAFVNLFVFSSPIVVTVKADEFGNWSYQFDKEIENGEHEIYVGMTDNTGRIVAISDPLKFVKTAEAYTPIQSQSAELVQTSSSDSFVGPKSMLIVASISVVSIGLLLLLLGHFLHFYRREDLVKSA